MRQRGGGSIVNNASNYGLRGFPGASAYIASKFAMVGMTKALATELGPENIRVNVVCPGNITTDMSASEFALAAKRLGVTPEEVERAQAEEAALKRRGKPEEVAEVIAFLASPASGFVAGVAIPVDGAQQRGV